MILLGTIVSPSKILLTWQRTEFPRQAESSLVGCFGLPGPGGKHEKKEWPRSL